MSSGIVAVDSATEYRDGEPGRLERAAVCLAVDTAGETADDDESRCGEVASEAARNLPAVRGARACADDRNGRPRQELDFGIAPEVEARRRIVDRAK
jgi:hypothetical protein